MKSLLKLDSRRERALKFERGRKSLASVYFTGADDLPSGAIPAVGLRNKLGAPSASFFKRFGGTHHPKMRNTFILGFGREMTNDIIETKNKEVRRVRPIYQDTWPDIWTVALCNYIHTH